MTGGRRGKIFARVQALERKFALVHQPEQESVFSRFYAGPVPAIRDLFTDEELASMPGEQIRERIRASLPPISEEFRNMSPWQLYEIYREEIARSKS